MYFVAALIYWALGFALLFSFFPGEWRVALESVSPYIFIIMAISVPIAAVFAVRYTPYKVNKLSQMADYNYYKFRKVINVKTVLIFGAALFLLGSGGRRRVNTPDSSFTVYALIAFGVICGAWITVYKIHLLNKYCSYLKTLEDRRYDRGDPPPDLLTF